MCNRDRPRASALTDDGGRFALRAPAAGRYGVRVRRVERLAAGETVARTLTLVPRAGTLPPVRAETYALCDRRRDRGGDAARFWHATRALLEGAAAAEGTGLLAVDAATWTRDVDAAGAALRGRDVTRSGRVARPFAAAEPAQLARSGYASWGADSASFFAPDATVLVSDTFAAGHCVRLAGADADTAHAGAVGLAFEPVRARNVVEVRGTLWVDSTSGVPRDFGFAYVWPRGTVPDGVAARYGGEIAFTTLPSGAVVVRRWELRVPLPVAERPSAAREWGTRTVGAALRTVRDEGGVLLARFERDGRMRAPLPGALAGVVFDSLRGIPVAGAQVLVSRTPADDGGERTLYMAATDDDGRWHVDTLPAGAYGVTVAAPAFDSLGIQLPEARDALDGGDTVRVAMHVPGAATTLAALCGAPLDDDAGAVVGTVRDVRAPRAPAGAIVELSWGGQRGVRGSVRAPVDSLGTWHACGTPRLLPVSARLLVRDGATLRALGATSLDGPRAALSAGDLVISGRAVALAGGAAGATRLGAVTVTERAGIATPRPRERIGGGGRALTFDWRVIADRSPSKLTDLLRTSPSLLIQANGDVRPAIMDRVPSRRPGPATTVPAAPSGDAPAADVSKPPTPEAETATACTLRVVANGKSYAGPVDDFPPSQVRRMEVYLSAASMPAEFADSRAGCGVIAVWTEDGTATARP